jgi:DHA1 family inner membrane transport protein
MKLSLTALSLGTFALGTTEFIVAGLLPSVAADLSISVPVAGFVITAYAIGVAIGGPLLTLTLTLARVPPRAALLALIAIFTLGQGVCALAPTYAVLVVARVIVAACHGAFFGIAVVLATHIVPPERSGRAVALLLAGVTTANVLGVPAGSAIGNLFGWRLSFWSVLVLGAIATAAIAAWVPDSRPAQVRSSKIGEQIGWLLRPAVSLTFAVIVLSMAGQLALFSFVVPYLTSISNLSVDVVPWFLLIFGLGSTLGVIAGGRLADWRLPTTLMAVLVAQVVAYLAIVAAGRSGVFMLPFALVWGFAAFAFSPAAQAKVLRDAGPAVGLASSLIPTAFNIGIAIGAAGGAALLEWSGTPELLPWAGVVASSAAVLAFAASQMLGESAAVRPAVRLG